jgi:hypothetical protein
MDIVLTDVTDMGGGHVCVAGWSLEEERMIRLLRDVYGNPHWPSEMANDGFFFPGNIVTPTPSQKRSNRSVPHATEDFLVFGVPTVTGSIDHSEMVATVSGSVYDSVLHLFGDAFTDRRYTPENAGSRSLGAVETRQNRMGFNFDDRYGSLKCWFYDGSGERYSFRLTCKALKDSHSQLGMNGLNELKTHSSTAHIRLGLANPWDGGSKAWSPKRCYAMVNGIFFV